MEEWRRQRCRLLRRMLASDHLHPAGGLQRRAARAMGYYLGKNDRERAAGGAV